MTKPERPLSVQSGDLGGDAGQRARRAGSGRSVIPNRTGGFDQCGHRPGSAQTPEPWQQASSDTRRRNWLKLPTALQGVAERDRSFRVDMILEGLGGVSAPRGRHLLAPIGSNGAAQGYWNRRCCAGDPKGRYSRIF
jgi:hypothetical protein